jgi:hypothetical protein
VQQQVLAKERIPEVYGESQRAHVDAREELGEAEGLGSKGKPGLQGKV